MLNTFSANTLKRIEENPNFQGSELSFILKTPETVLGQELHKLIYYYIKKFDIKKIENNLDEAKRNLWEKIKNSEILNKNFVLSEESFLIKLGNYFLDGRFDAIYKENGEYTIVDWKTKHIPQNPKDDIQTIVYLYCASKLLKTEKIKMKYVTLTSLETAEIQFEDEKEYEKRILGIIEKYKAN